MNNLNDLDKIAQIDTKNTRKYIAELGPQIQLGWSSAQKLIIPSFYPNTSKVVILGMGGSGIAGALVQALLKKENPHPIIIHRDYGVPAFVDNKTLVIAVSHSGGTEEVLDGFVAAFSKGAKLIAITTGGKLESLAKKYRAPLYKYQSDAPQPRAAMGYGFGAILGVMKKIGLMSELAQKDIDEAIVILNQVNENLKPENKTGRNLAKRIANQIFGSVPFVWSAENLEEVARRWKCQFNENSKYSSYFEALPELNHNTIADLDFPKPNPIYVLILQSKYYNPRIHKRIGICREILDKKEIPNLLVNLELKCSALAEMLAYVLLGDYTSFYLGILHEVDPSSNETIIFLKDRLQK
ncbi:MAG TPA: bifunctional phosphoglucose/phosphomannose isomerase [Patescibacteria group bacterium]|nr:bifunctional phosphoglucose/phosphomannose isomerase [Patescibacteria group bacterium]